MEDFIMYAFIGSLAVFVGAVISVFKIGSFEAHIEFMLAGIALILIQICRNYVVVSNRK